MRPMTPPETDEALTFRVLGAGAAPLFFELSSPFRPGDLASPAGPAAMREPILRLQFDAQWGSYRHEFPRADRRLILRGGRPVGWVVVDRSGAELHGIDIALLAEERSRGIGTVVVRALQQEAAADGRPMTIT